MMVPDRETAYEIVWFADGLLSSGGDVLPVGLTAALREYKAALLAESANESWARFGRSTRYGILADSIEREIADGKWKCGERLPSVDRFAATYGERADTVGRALHILAVRGCLALEHHSYYVLPDDMP